MRSATIESFPVKKSRRYEDPCGIARAIDAVGERWAMLIVRELFFGPKRFTDLKRGVAGASPNVLSQRLDELEADGIVRRRQLDPPSPAWVYELTDRGHALEEILLALGRWGSRIQPIPKGELTLDALLLALRTTFDGGDLEGEIELRFDRDHFRARATDGKLVIERGAADAPAATIDTDPISLRQVVFGNVPLRDARKVGSIGVRGSQRAASRFIGSFSRPKPA